MSVLMTLRVNGDGAKVEQEDSKMMSDIADKAKTFGLISHHFYGGDNEILVVDEWRDEESFQRFYEASPEIAGIIERSGATAEPEVRFWRQLDTGDDVG
jgi:heme-degrading monooxygenase HmoA